MRGNFAESNESEIAEKSVMWPPSVDDEKIDVVSNSRRYGSERWMPMPSGRHEPTYTDLLSGFGANADSSHGFCATFVDQPAAASTPMRKHMLDQEGKYNLLASPWSLMSAGLSLNLSESNAKVPGQCGDITYQARGNIRCSAFSEYPMLPGYRVEQSHGNWLRPPPAPSHLDNHTHSRELMPKPIVVQEHETGKSMDGNCKLFGIPLVSNPIAPPEPAGPQRNMLNEPVGQMHPVNHQVRALESDQKSEQSKGSKMADDNEHEKQFQAGHPPSRDIHGKAQSVSTRSCTKVLSHLFANIFQYYEMLDGSLAKTKREAKLLLLTSGSQAGNCTW